MIAAKEFSPLQSSNKTFRLLFLSAVAVCLILLSTYYSDYRDVVLEKFPTWKSVSILNMSREETEMARLPLIAYWKHPFGRKGYGPRSGEHCGCKYTYDRSLLKQSDAVVSYCRDADKSDLPPDFPNRTADQKYVWWCLEPPTHIDEWGIDLSYRNGFFNWTMTPRRDSNIRVSWGFLDDMKSALREENLTTEYLMSLKNRTAIAIVSSCGSVKNHGAKARLRLIKEIKEKGLDLDLFGKCFKNPLDRKQPLANLRKYKFYLSFENSYHCRDYISEKFWMKGIGLGVVPVAWGARKEDYLAIAPKSSFIFVEDFDSVGDLVKYLKYLDKNSTAYMEYLEWRSPWQLRNFKHERRIPPIGHDFMTGCELCRHLLKRRDSNDKSVSIVPSIENFYYDPKDEGGCLRGASKNESYWKYSVD